MFVKTLRLITPERAIRMGVVAEAPVFVSAFTEPTRCRLCRPSRVYAPLVYQVGYEVTPHHVHPEQQVGGVYTVRDGFEPVRKLDSWYHARWSAYLEGEVAYELGREGCALRSAQVVRIRPISEGGGADGSLEETLRTYLPVSLVPAGSQGPDTKVKKSDWKYRIVGPEIVFTRLA